MDQIFGYIERITFQNQENGFTVARLKMPRKQDLITIVGALPPIQPGEKVRCQGLWKMNASHGMQFEVKECSIEAPTDLIGIQKYLASGLIYGIGPAYAERIIKKFGVKTLEIIDQNPDLLSEVEGLGTKRIGRIKESWVSQRCIRKIMFFLQRYGISPSYAHKLYKVYGDKAEETLEENPYALAKTIHGIGFKAADAIAEKIGIKKDAPIRIDSGIEFLLWELSQEGHTCYPMDQFVKKAEEVFGVALTLIEERLAILVKEGKIHVEVIEEVPFVWLKGLFLSEVGIANEIKRIKNAPSNLRAVDRDKAIDWVEKELRINLAPNQQEAVKQSLCEKFHIITGGPGTGKSTITKAILAITSKLTRRIILAAPTGRAAKRMSEITRKEAFTIHSLLQYDFKEGGFRRNRENPLQADLIIIDESSMIDTSLMYHLLKAIPTEARVLFVGDIHQLPSVGPGNVLKDMIDSEKLPVTTLNKIFRQAAGSLIITNAHRINEGRLPVLKNEENGDFFFVQKEEGKEVLDEILDLVSKRLKEHYKLDPIEAIQVLAPMKRGVIGTHSLNVALQERLNPNKEGHFHAGSRFSVGDKVMQIRNNYQKEIYNGDIGRIEAINEDQILINYDGKSIPYGLNELDEVTLAYATSIHKYQGSECPCVVIPVHTSHFVMLHRNLLYTGVTRGKRLVVLVGQLKAVAMAVANDDVKKRFTSLRFKLLN